MKKFKLVTPLYVEVLPRVLQFNNVDEEKGFGAFNYDSGSNQISYTCRSKQVKARLVHEGNVYGVPIPETQVPETQFPYNGILETQMLETQFVDCDMHET